MPVEIQCAALVARDDALTRILERGVDEFFELAETCVCFGDGVISQASFMAEVDRNEFARKLEIRGLSSDQDAPDYATVHVNDRTVHPECDWLVLFEYDGRFIATMRGNESREVVASQKRMDGIKHVTAEELETEYEFVGREGTIDTFRHKETGELIYSNRSTETPDEIFKRSFATIWEHHREPGQAAKTGDDAETLRAAIGELQSLVAEYGDNSRLGLALGMAWFAIGNANTAIAYFEKAIANEPENTFVSKELGSVYLSEQRFDDALRVGRQAVCARPDDVELLGNLATTQLLAGHADDATATIEHALSLAPDDEVNINIKSRIDDVASGKRPQPTSLEELMQA